MGVVSEKKAYREEMLLSALREKKTMDVAEVIDLLKISESTARRFFGELEEKGEIIRTYGGIQLAPEPITEYSVLNSELLYPEEKHRIATYALSFVKSGDIIYVDNGTTLHCFASLLARLIQNGTLTNIQVYTNSLRNLQILTDICDVNLIGGLYRSSRQDFSGYLTETVLETLSFQKAFMGTDAIGLSAKEGLMTTDAATAKINEIMTTRSNKMFLLADSSKFNRRSFIRYGASHSAYMIITDTGLDRETYEAFLNQRIRIERV